VRAVAGSSRQVVDGDAVDLARLVVGADPSDDLALSRGRRTARVRCRHCVRRWVVDLAIPNVVAELGQSRRRIAAVEAANRLHRPTGFKVQRALAANRGSGRARTWQRLVVQPLRLSPGVRSFAVSERPLEGELGGSVAGRLGHGRARHRPTGGILIPAARSAGVAFAAASNPLSNGSKSTPDSDSSRYPPRLEIPATKRVPAGFGQVRSGARASIAPRRSVSHPGSDGDLRTHDAA
jgi:hypothetical protein